MRLTAHGSAVACSFVNSLAVTDHNLLDFGADVVIGNAVHLSGHTVERGRLAAGKPWRCVATSTAATERDALRA
jgi:hypothetical protein